MEFLSNTEDMDMENMNMEEMEKEMEKQEIDHMFQEKDISEIQPLYDVLRNFLDTTPISSMMHKHKNINLLLFAETINGVLYRGYIKAVYMDLTRLKNLGKCLYITHVIISPRKGNILDRDLKRILHDAPNVDSIFIESILSDKVLNSFVSKGWTLDNYSNNVFIKKVPGGGKKKTKRTTKRQNTQNKKRKTRRYKKITTPKL